MHGKQAVDSNRFPIPAIPLWQAMYRFKRLLHETSGIDHEITSKILATFKVYTLPNLGSIMNILTNNDDRLQNSATDVTGKTNYSCLNSIAPSIESRIPPSCNREQEARY